jgi:hypothetical protein
LSEAVAMTVVDDLQNSLDPNDRRAPAEFWDRLAHVLKHGSPVRISDVTPGGKLVLATQMTLVLERAQQSADDFSQFNVPPAMGHIEPQRACA